MPRRTQGAVAGGSAPGCDRGYGARAWGIFARLARAFCAGATARAPATRSKRPRRARRTRPDRLELGAGSRRHPALDFYAPLYELDDDLRAAGRPLTKLVCRP